MDNMRTELLELEEGFWEAHRGGDIEFYRQHLADDSLTVGPLGELDKESALSLLGQAHCPDYTLSDPRFVKLTDEAAVLAYRATLHGEESPESPCSEHHVVSAYARRDGAWQRVFHMQLPVPE
jgi:hypothetical protein